MLISQVGREKNLAISSPCPGKGTRDLFQSSSAIRKDSMTTKIVVGFLIAIVTSVSGNAAHISVTSRFLIANPTRGTPQNPVRPPTIPPPIVRPEVRIERIEPTQPIQSIELKRSVPVNANKTGGPRLTANRATLKSNQERAVNAPEDLPFPQVKLKRLQGRTGQGTVNANQGGRHRKRANRKGAAKKGGPVNANKTGGPRYKPVNTNNTGGPRHKPHRRS